jgi:hypothetical protein
VLIVPTFRSETCRPCRGDSIALDQYARRVLVVVVHWPARGKNKGKKKDRHNNDFEGKIIEGKPKQQTKIKVTNGCVWRWGGGGGGGQRGLPVK